MRPTPRSDAWRFYSYAQTKKAPAFRLALLFNLAPPTGLNGGAQPSDIFRAAEQLKKFESLD
ncbi:hypothetical protein BZG73_07655 [Salinivibrio siamensis]|uniref:Uncharacterized protein n=1 Tax=Salinivibrio siamensis TaxID=414286 RepID=A0ABX3K9Y2_9GAMM|nr:hypothetical protein BZG73_07655 [Salinivibrio siamensis]